MSSMECLLFGWVGIPKHPFSASRLITFFASSLIIVLKKLYLAEPVTGFIDLSGSISLPLF